MNRLVLLPAGFLLLVALAVIVRPQAMKQLFRQMLTHRWMGWAAGFRVVLGLLLLLGAGGTRAPGTVRALAVLVLAGAVLLPLLGARRVERWASWWVERPNAVLQMWALVAGVLGLYLVWVAY